jgi:hypothetical protein
MDMPLLPGFLEENPWAGNATSKLFDGVAHDLIIDIQIKVRCHACFELQHSKAAGRNAATAAEAARTVSRIVTVAFSRYLNEPIDPLYQFYTCGAPGILAPAGK